MSCALKNLSKRNTCSRQPEAQAFIEAGSRDITELCSDLDGLDALSGEPVKSGQTRAASGASATSPFGGGNEDDDAVRCFAISPAGNVAGNAAAFFGDRYGIGGGAETAVPSP